MGSTEQPFRPGQFVWCLFPYDQQPDEPGPVEHVTYILQIARHASGKMIAACAYTTSQPWTKSEEPPPGVMAFNKEEASRLGQARPFILDTRRVAFLPLDAAFFHRIGQADHGILLRISKPSFQIIVNNALAKALKRPEHIRMVGPFRPGTGKAAAAAKSKGPGRGG